MDQMIDYPITRARLCNEGIRLRSNVWAHAYRIDPQAWNDTPEYQQPSLLTSARSLNDDYTLAFSAWRAHRANCVRCQEATGQ